MGFQPLLYHLHRPFSFFCLGKLAFFFSGIHDCQPLFSSTKFLASLVQFTELCLLSHLQGTRPVFFYFVPSPIFLGLFPSFIPFSELSIAQHFFAFFAFFDALHLCTVIGNSVSFFYTYEL
jgi:hypothetical protein